MATMPYVKDPAVARRALRLVERSTMPADVSVKHLAANGFAGEDAKRVRGFLQALGLVSPNGSPTPTWVGYRESDDRAAILAEAVRTAYAPLFDRGDPTSASLEELTALVGRAGGVPPDTCDLVASTFKALCDSSGLTSEQPPRPGPRERQAVVQEISRLLKASVEEFETARVCLRAGLLRPAFVAAWNSYAAMAFAHLSERDFAAFRTGPRRAGLDVADLLRKVNGTELIELLLAQDLISPDDRIVLEHLLRQRNDCAHPTPYEPSREEAAIYLSAVLGQASVLTEHPLT